MPLNLDNINLDKLDRGEKTAEDVVNESISQRAKVNYSGALSSNPDEYAQYLKMAEQAQLPVDAVAADPKSVENKLKVDQINFDELTKNSPNTARFMTDYNKTVIVHDDLTPMQRIEKVFDFKKTFSGAGTQIGLEFKKQGEAIRLKASERLPKRREDLIPVSAMPLHVPIQHIQQMSIDRAEAFGIMNDEQLAEAKEEGIQEAIKNIQKINTEIQAVIPKDLNILEEGVRGGYNSLAQMAPGFTLTLATRSPYPMLATMGTQTYLSSYGEGRSKGLTIDEANLFASIDAGIEVLTEIIPAKTLGKMVGIDNVGEGVAKNLLRFTISEMTGEQIATLGQSLNSYAFDLDEQLAQAKTLEEAIDIQLRRQAVTAISTVFAGGVQSGTAVSINKTINYLATRGQVQEQQSNKEQQFIDDLNAVAMESKLRERDAESFKQFIEQNDGEANTQVYIDAAQLKLYLDSIGARGPVYADEGVRLLAEQINQLPDGDVAIPVADFATYIAGTEHFDNLREFMSLTETSEAPFRQEQAKQEAEAYMDSLIEEAQQNASEYVEAQDIFNNVRDQLIDSGVYSPANASVMAQLVPAWATVYARDNNISVAEAYQRSGLIIEGPQTGRLAEMQQQDIPVVEHSQEEINSRLNREKPRDQRRMNIEPTTEERKGDRRQDSARRDKIAAMTPEEQYKAIYTNELTGLNNRRAFEEDLPDAPVVASIDVDSLKAVNDNLGHDAGDNLLRVAANAINDSTNGKAYHISGDEFYVLGESTEQVQAALQAAADRLRDESVTSDKGTLDGVAFTSGVADSKEAADAAMEQAKADREASGERTPRGESPTGLKLGQPVQEQFQQRVEMHSAVANAVRDIKLPQWKNDGSARGQDVWDKIKSTGGIKQEELQWLGIEEFLTVDPEAKFTRAEVMDYVTENGVQVEEVIADQEASENELEWMDREVWDDPEAWSYRVEDYMYEFDNGDADWFDKNSWLTENIEDVVENYKGSMGKDSVTELEEYDGDADSQLQVIREAGYDPESDFDSQMRDEAEEQANEMAKSEYEDNPIYIQRSADFSDGSELIIFGNEDQGFDVRTSMNYSDVVASDIWSQEEAEIQALNYAYENDLLTVDGDVESTKWEEYVTDGRYENYREIKLTLPDIKGDFYNDVHFPDRNLLTFLRVTDRDLSYSEFKPREKLNVEVRIVDNPVEDAVVKKVVQVVNSDTGEVINSAAPDFSKYENEQAVIDQVSGKLKEPGVRFNYKDRKFIVDVKGELVEEFSNEKKTFFIEEFQSDWHQQGRQQGYATGQQDPGELDYQASEMRDDARGKLAVIRDDIISDVPESSKETITAAKRILNATTTGDLYTSLDEIIKGKIKTVGDETVKQVQQRLFEDIKKSPEILEAAELIDQARQLEKQAVAEREGVPDAPFKGDAWLTLGLKRALQQAAEQNYEAFAWPNAQVLMDRWSDRYQTLYETQYNTKMVSQIKKLTKQQPKQLSFEGEEVQHQEQGYWVIEMTPELRDRILNNGFTLFQDTRGYYEPANSLIRLTEAANLSTFLHEFAHFMYEQELKVGSDKVQQINKWFKSNAEDIAKEATGYANKGEPDFTRPKVEVFPEDVKIFLAANTTGDQAKDAAIREAVHEQFARGFEAYLMEGKAPSIELRNIFSTFARWLAQIYDSIRKSLKVNLNDDARQFFDRLLATEEQITAARARAQYEPMFNDAAVAGMTDEQFAKYQDQQQKTKSKESDSLREKLMNEIRRQTKAWWKREKQDVIDEQLINLRNEPVYRATESLRGAGTLAKFDQQIKEFNEQEKKLRNKLNRKGVNSDDILKQIDEISVKREKVKQQQKSTPIKLDHATVKEMVGETFTDSRGRDYQRIPARLKGMTAKGAVGVHPDEAAAFFGFKSGSEMLDAIINEPTLKQAADTAAEQIMVELHGDILNDGTIEQQADEALLNEERGKLILTELKALAKRHNTPTLDRQTIKQLAKERIGKLSFRQIHPGKYRKAEVRAAQEAARMLAEGNTEGAMQAKSRQVMNYYLTMAANEAKNNTVKIVDRMARYNKKSVKESIMKAGEDYWQQLSKILSRFEFRKGASLRAVDQANQDINTWMKDKIEQEGDGLVLTAAVLNETYTTHWKNVPYDDLKGIDDSVKNIEHVARYANKLTRMGEEIEFKKLVSNWVDKMNESNKTKFAAQRTDVVKGKNWGRWAMAQMTKIPWMASWLDGGERVGLSHQILVQPMTDAYDAELKLWKKIGNKVLESIENRDKETLKRHNRKIFIKEIQDEKNDGNLYGHQVLAVALNTGNQSNLRKMLLGEGWAVPDNEETISMDNPKLQAVLKHMNKKDWDLVQLIWDQMEELYPQLTEVHQRTTGLTPPKVEASPVVTEHGTYRGGYYPVKYDSNRSHQAAMTEDRMNAEVDSMFNTIGSIQASVNAGATNERTKYYAPIRLSLDVVPGHFQEVIHYITHHDAVREVNKLIRNKEVAETIKEKLGPEEYAQLKPWLNDIAKDGRMQSTKMFWDSILQRLRFGVTLGVMGFKVSTGIIQVSGLSNTVAEVGLSNVLASSRSILGSPKKMREAWDFAKSNSKVLEHRTQTMDREIKNAMNRLAGKRGVLAAVQETSMKHIALIQTFMVDLPSWHAAYSTSMKEHGDETRAYQYADWVIENVQGSGATKDLARIMRNQSETGRMFTMFMTFFSSLWNNQRDVVRGTASGRYSYTNIAAKGAFLMVIPVLFEMLLRGELGGDDEPEKDLQEALTKVAIYPVQGVPFVRDVVNGSVGEYGYNMSPIASLLEQGTQTIPEVVKRGFTDDEITEGQAKGATKFLGAAAGIPGTGQAWATGEHLYDVIVEGEDLTVQELLFGPERD